MSIAPVPLGISYVDPDGYTWDLSDPSMKNGYICSAIAGIEGFPVMMQTIPMLDGTAIPNFYLPQAGTIGIVIAVTRPTSDDQNDYYALLDKIVRAFLSRRNELPKPGTLIVKRPDGTQRKISTYTTSGLDTPEVGLNDISLYSFSLSTPDPYWCDMVPSTLTFGLPKNSGIFPLLPIIMDGPTAFGNQVITNKGTALSFPTWNITGPGTPTITNNSANPVRSFSLSAIPAGQVVQVVTQRGKQMVVNLTTGANLWSQLVTSSPRDLWPLMGGDNKVSIVLTGATPASSVVVSWTNKWSRA